MSGQSECAWECGWLRGVVYASVQDGGSEREIAYPLKMERGI